MKLFRTIFAIAVIAFGAFGCSGTVDESALPILKADVTEVDLANPLPVNFMVTYEGADVTAEAEIFMEGSQAPLGASFTAETEGSYGFYADYDGKSSNMVKVSVKNSIPEVKSQFERYVLITEFTGAWCANCPKGLRNLQERLGSPMMDKYRDNVHLCAFHDNTGGADDMAIAETQAVFGLFRGLAYPSFATDLRNVTGHFGNLNEAGIDYVQSSVIASFERYSTHCGVAVASVLNAEKTEASVTVKLTSEYTDDYRVVLLVLENGIVGPQKDSQYDHKEYTHNHVVRKVVTEYAGTFGGEKITDDGKVADGDEVSKTWKFGLDEGWNPDKMEIYALALDSNNFVNNMNLCAIDGGDSGYNYKE